MTWLALLIGCGDPTPVATTRHVATPADLEAHCAEQVGDPRVEEVTDGVFVARGYDLANTVVVQTDDGRVVIDAGMSPTRAHGARLALDEVTSGPVRALIYTHSHVDHVGGAAIWVESGTQIWATEAFEDHFFKQYGVFLPAETTRAARQFGLDVPDSELPCSALGRNVDLRAALQNGARLPTHTFTGQTRLTVGGVTLDLVEAHGETDDQLFVYLPDQEVLLPGDNVYTSFPNLYTIRGTRPRPTRDWIASLDAMRALDPAVLVPSHTNVVAGRDAVRARLRTYRDGIQWVADSVVRAANAGTPLEEAVAAIGLPDHLASAPELAELYGQLDWSVRALYTNELGWFDGRASQLYPLPPGDRATRLIASMGGVAAVRSQAQASDDPRWALELLELLEAAGTEELDLAFAQAYEALAEQTANTNGRGYLLVAAAQRRAGEVVAPGQAALSPAFVASIPIEHVLGNLVARLRPEEAIGVHETVLLAFTDHPHAWLTVRHGLLEIVWGTPLPGTPEPVATATLSTGTWKSLALGHETPAEALANDHLEVDGLLALRGFLARFDQGLIQVAERLP